MRAREGRPPLDYEGCMEIFKKRIGVPNQNKLGKESQGKHELWRLWRFFKSMKGYEKFEI